LADISLDNELSDCGHAIRRGLELADLCKALFLREIRAHHDRRTQLRREHACGLEYQKEQGSRWNAVEN